MITLILFISCKKKNTPSPDYYMTLKVNGTEIKYTTCNESETIVDDQTETTIAGYYSSALDKTAKMFEITLIADENNLKTGQVFQCQGINSATYDNGSNVFFHYLTDSDDAYGVSSSPYNPIGKVTLTEVTPTYIKGTFSALLGNNDGTVVLDTISSGTFYSSHNIHTGVIQY